MFYWQVHVFTHLIIIRSFDCKKHAMYTVSLLIEKYSLNQQFKTLNTHFAALHGLGYKIKWVHRSIQNKCSTQII